MQTRTPLQKWLWALGNLIVLAALIALVGALIRPLTMFIDHAQRALEYPYVLNYGEGPLLDQTLRLGRGDNLYPVHLDAPPYTITNYPPVYLLAQLPLVEASGVSFTWGRAISLVSMVVSAVMLALIARAITRDWSAALVSGGLLLAVPYVLHWSALARIDGLALALSLIGLWCAAARPGEWLSLTLAVVLLALAAYTRQTYLLAAPLAAFAWLWGARARASAFMLAAWLAAVVLVVFAVMLVLTEGGAFFHMVTANVNALDADILRFYADEMGRAMPILIVAGGVTVLGWLFLLLLRWDYLEDGSAAGWLAAPYALGALAAALTIAKVGSDVNYLLELSAALCLCAGVVVGWLKTVPLIKAAAIVGVIVQVFLMANLSETKYYRIIFDRTTPEQRAGVEQLMARLTAAANDGVIPLADEHMGLLTLIGQPILFQPFEMSQLALARQWDETPFVESLRAGAYPLLLLYQPMANPSLRFERWTPAMLRAINDVFRPDGQYAETIIYRYSGE